MKRSLPRPATPHREPPNQLKTQKPRFKTQKPPHPPSPMEFANPMANSMVNSTAPPRPLPTSVAPAEPLRAGPLSPSSLQPPKPHRLTASKSHARRLDDERERKSGLLYSRTVFYTSGTVNFHLHILSYYNENCNISYVDTKQQSSLLSMDLMHRIYHLRVEMNIVCIF